MLISLTAPLFDALDMKLENRVFNGSLFSRNTSGLFRQPPSPEVDAAWGRISGTPPFLVSRTAIEKVGKDPSLAVKVPESWGEGEKYLVQLEAHHHMHCLNELRQQAYADYYYPGGPTHPLHWIHIAHCLDILRQVITCSASVDLITFNWVETQKGGFPDFYVAHQCRDYEATMEWAQEQKRALRLDERLDELLEPPADAVVLPMEPEYYEYAPAMSKYLRNRPSKDGHYGSHHH